MQVRNGAHRSCRLNTTFAKWRIPMLLPWLIKFRFAIQSWRNNWDCLTSYFDFPLEIRKIIYTTNTIENLNRGIRKYTNKNAVPR